MNTKQFVRMAVLFVANTCFLNPCLAANHDSCAAPDKIPAKLLSPAKTRVEIARQSALLEERKGNDLAAQRYFELAQVELDAKLGNQALKDIRHGLRLYHKTGDSIGFNIAMMGSSSQHIDTARMAIALAKLNRVKDGEKILQEALIATNKSFGSDSCMAAGQVAEAFIFYIQLKKDREALKNLDQLLRFDLRLLEIGQPSTLDNFKACVYALTKQGNAKMALAIFDKVLIAQKKSFDSDDQRISATLVDIARVQESLNKNADAEKSLLDAVAIYRLYVGPVGLTSESSGSPGLMLCKLWGKTGRINDAKIVKAGYFFVSPTLLRRFGKVELANAILKTGKIPTSYIDPTYPHENGRQAFDLNAEPSEKIVQLQKEYREACIDAPYGLRASDALDNLSELALAQKNWHLLAQASTARCKIYEHSPDCNAGRNFSCVPLSSNRIDYYDQASQAYVHLGKIVEAQRWLERAEKNLPEKTCSEYKILASRELDCENKVLAAKYAEAARVACQAETR